MWLIADTPAAVSTTGPAVGSGWRAGPFHPLAGPFTTSRGTKRDKSRFYSRVLGQESGERAAERARHKYGPDFVTRGSNKYEGIRDDHTEAAGHRSRPARHRR